MITDGRLFKKDEKASLPGVSPRHLTIAPRAFSGKNVNGIPREGVGDEEIFSRKAFTAALLGELAEENDWGLPVTPEGKMEERKRKCAADRLFCGKIDPS